MDMSRFCSMLWSDTDNPPVARAPRDADPTHRLIPLGVLTDWAPIQFTVDRDPTDYLPNNFAIELCSARLREVVEAARSDIDELQWLEASVTTDREATLPYFVLHFPTKPDVLDRDRTTYSYGDQVIRPVVSLERVGRRQIFSYSRYGGGPIISAAMRRAIESPGCTGLDFGVVHHTEL
jgi:hypothetical protein